VLVGFRAKLHGTTAKHLAAGFELNVDFKPDGGDVFLGHGKNGGFGELAREIQCGILEIAPRLSMLRHRKHAESLHPSSGIAEKDHFHAE
jgi:hypothetical protein